MFNLMMNRGLLSSARWSVHRILIIIIQRHFSTRGILVERPLVSIPPNPYQTHSHFPVRLSVYDNLNI